MSSSSKLMEVWEERYNLCMLFYCLKRDDDHSEDEGGKYDIFDSITLKAMFAKLLGIPKYTLMASFAIDHAWNGACVFVGSITIDDQGKLYCESVPAADAAEMGDIAVWDLKTNGRVGTLTFPDDIVRGHTSRGSSAPSFVLEYYDGKVYCADEGYFCVWNSSDDFSLVANLKGHSKAIRSLSFQNEKMYSQSSDKSIIVWNTKDYSVIATLRIKGHRPNGIAHTIDYFNDKLYSTQYGGFIQVFDCTSYEEIAELKPPTTTVPGSRVMGPITCYDNKLYCGHGDTKIYVWNCEDDSFVTTLTGQRARISHLVADNDKLYSGSLDGRILVWNRIEGHNLITTLNLPQQGFMQRLRIYIYNGQLFAHNGHTISIWNCHDLSLVTTLQGPQTPVSKMKFFDDKLYVRSEHCVEVWKI